MNGKNSQKLLDHAKQSATDALETASKRAIQKTAEATGDLIGDNTDDKITKFSRSLQQSSSGAGESETEIPKKACTYLQKRDNKLLMT